jgi:hypothetical protein
LYIGVFDSLYLSSSWGCSLGRFATGRDKHNSSDKEKMTQRRLPETGSEEAKEWCKVWDAGTHIEKLELCQRFGVQYNTGRHFKAAHQALPVKPDYKLPPDTPLWEQFEILEKLNKLVAFHQKVPTEISLVIPETLPIGVVFFADEHVGAFGVDLESLKRDWIIAKEEPGLYTMQGGDGYHNIIQPSKMGSSHNQAPICVQKAVYANMLKENWGKILCVGIGQHNYWSALMDGEDWDGELARRFKLVYTKHAARINLKVGEMLYPILRMHKSRFNSAFNWTHTCKQNQRLYFPDCRIIVAEDKHVADMEQYRYNEQECVAIRTGTYCTYDDFAQQNGFFGSHVCNPTVVLYPNQDKVVGFKDMHDAITFLRAVRAV